MNQMKKKTQEFKTKQNKNSVEIDKIPKSNCHFFIHDISVHICM